MLKSKAGATIHAKQVVQGASGNAVPSQVVEGVSFSNSSGPQTGTMETITSGDYKISDSGVVSITTGKYTGTASTSTNQYQITSSDITKIIQHNADLSASATDPKVLSGYTYYGANGKSTGTMTNYGYEPTASRLGIYNPGIGNYLYSYLPTNSVDNTCDAGNGYVQRSGELLRLIEVGASCFNHYCVGYDDT